jgi:hypothetical protein
MSKDHKERFGSFGNDNLWEMVAKVFKNFFERVFLTHKGIFEARMNEEIRRFGRYSQT